MWLKWVAYFKINKIEYDPIKKGSYKVELLKVNDIEIEIKRGTLLQMGFPN